MNCTSGYFYNQTTKKCEIIVCPQGQYYDVDINRCKDKLQNTVSMCPPDKPFWNSTAIRCEVCPNNYPIYQKLYNRCVACPAGTTWSANQGLCLTPCPNGQIYNESAK